MNCWHCNTELIWGGDHEADANGYTIIESWTGQDLLYCNDLFALQMIIDENDFSVTPSANSEFHSWDLNENGLIEHKEFGGVDDFGGNAKNLILTQRFLFIQTTKKI